MRKNTVTGFLLALLLGAGFSAMAQTPEQRAEISRKYDHEKIAQLRDKLKQRHEENYNKALDLAKINGWPLRIVEDGRVAVLSGVNYDNTPLYKTTDNVNAATTARVPAVRTGGSLNLDVNGQDMIIGIWEIGEVRTTHVDLTGRVTVKDGSTFTGHNDENLHATHVSGTMIGSGAGNPDALGLAYEAELWAYESNNDAFEALNAAEDGLLVSNHSYGLRLNDNTQWMRGQYTQESEEWDEVLFEAPYYQAVISAGNDGNGNTFDLLLGNKTSKNAVIVAATQAVLNYNPNNPNAVVLASFTSYGPTDDRRIKPDIATDGWMLNSCSSLSNTAYVQESGTSMASPGVAASLTLMQQHYHDTFNEWMRASTVKALMINTADEIGPADGPDAKTGWGLINVTKAVQLITAADNQGAIINEITLDSGGDDYVLPIQAHGDKPLKATIVWTDPAGSANNSGTPNNNLKLRNDLDIRIVKDGETFMPWALNPFSVSQAAVKDDNAVDNVETIEIDNPVAGATYTITVSHKGFALFNFQDQVFSLVVDGADENLGIAENTVDKVRIYPNPAHGIINISLGSLANGSDGSVTMYDLQGRLVKQYNSIVDKVDVSALTAGMYIINIENNGFKHSQKIIVE